ncbi:hypothetical protein LB543_26765, partial [Mesorhizobium sp. ESP7-2]|uniref:hypothetical protein n=1 Tax=Mesorhizobium sp. ESP7-2 TaxID=2876622 RepID=UPI001CCD69D7
LMNHAKPLLGILKTLPELKICQSSAKYSDVYQSAKKPTWAFYMIAAAGLLIIGTHAVYKLAVVLGAL